MERRSRVSREYDYQVRVVLVGNSAVGKSSLMLRFTDDNFKETYVNTIGVDFRFKTIQVDGAKVKIDIRDTAGQEKFRALNGTYYRGCDAVMMVYDITNERSFREIENYWVQEIKNYVEESTIFMVIGNKCDLPHERVIAPDTARALQVGSTPVIFFETSAKDSSNVHLAFEQMCRLFVEKKKLKRKARKDMSMESLGASGILPSREEENADQDDQADIYNLHMQLSSAKAEKSGLGGCKC